MQEALPLGKKKEKKDKEEKTKIIKQNRKTTNCTQQLKTWCFFFKPTLTYLVVQLNKQNPQNQSWSKSQETSDITKFQDQTTLVKLNLILYKLSFLKL